MQVFPVLTSLLGPPGCPRAVVAGVEARARCHPVGTRRTGPGSRGRRRDALRAAALSARGASQLSSTRGHFPAA